MKRHSLLPLKLVIAYAAFTAFYWIVHVAAPEFHQRWFRGEDKLVEWLTFSGFFLGFIALAVTARAIRTTAKLWSTLYVAGLALFMFMCAGEEISWGQRLLGFKTPEKIEKKNEQQEFNLHNMNLKHVHPEAIVSWLIKGFGIVAPLALTLARRNQAHAWRRYVAPLALIPCFLFAEISVPVAKATARRVEPRVGPDEALVIKRDTVELKEMYWGLTMMLAALSIRGAWRKKSVEGRVSGVEA